jgi:hypothetical protein
VSMLDVHAEALETGSGPYHELLLMYKALKKVVYGFIEGKEDPSYYRGFIENGLPDGWMVRLIRSGNKRAVLEVLSSISWTRFDEKRICFFVDRDLSEYLSEKIIRADNLYITDNYSVENDVVTGHVFARVIEEIFCITDLREDEREEISEKFETNLHLFCETMAPVMAQILIWRRRGDNAALANIKPQALFLFRDGRAEIEVAERYAAPNARVVYAAGCVGLSASDEEAVRIAEREFRDRSGPSRFVRGKYLLWLFVESAAAVHRAISYYCPRYPKPPKVGVSLGAGNAMAIIGPRAKAPHSLKQFIEKNYLAYIQNASASA